MGDAGAKISRGVCRVAGRAGHCGHQAYHLNRFKATHAGTRRARTLDAISTVVRRQPKASESNNCPILPEYIPFSPADAHVSHQKTNEKWPQNGHEIVGRVRRIEEVDPLLQHQRKPN